MFSVLGGTWWNVCGGWSSTSESISMFCWSSSSSWLSDLIILWALKNNSLVMLCSLLSIWRGWLSSEVLEVIRLSWRVLLKWMFCCSDVKVSWLTCWALPKWIFCCSDECCMICSVYSWGWFVGGVSFWFCIFCYGWFVAREMSLEFVFIILCCLFPFVAGGGVYLFFFCLSFFPIPGRHPSQPLWSGLLPRQVSIGAKVYHKPVQWYLTL